MLVAYLSGHGFGHMTRACEVLAALRERAPHLPLTVVGEVPEPLVRRALPGTFTFRAQACDVGLVQRDALHVDEEATEARCQEFDARWDGMVEREAEHLRLAGARAVLADIPPLAFAAAARAHVPALGLANFSWDWIYRHLAVRHPGLAGAAARAEHAYAGADLLLEMPFAGDLGAFPRRAQIGLVARRPRVARGEARRRLGLDGRPAVLISFGGVGLPGLAPDRLTTDPDLRILLPAELGTARLDALGLSYPDVVGASDVVVTKPGYGIVSDAIGAGTRLVYTERGDFPEYPILVREMPRWLACVHLGNEDLLAGRVADSVWRVLAQPMPPPPDLGGAGRAAELILASLR